MITDPPAGPLTQGVIFSGAVAEDYEGCPVHGLVITARCDSKNGKAEVYSYLPVVRFEDWLVRDGSRILARRIERIAMGDLRQCLTQLGHADAVLNTHPPQHVLKVIFDVGDVPPKVKERRPQFEKAAKRHAAAQACLVATSTYTAAIEIFETEQNEVAKLIKELCQNGIAESYYIPRVQRGENSPGYVVLLREIRHIPKRLAAAIASGIDAIEYKALSDHESRLAGRLNVAGEAFSLPVGLVQSPFIEHLMQRFTLLFSRIGVTDVDDATVKRLQNCVPRTNRTI